MLEILRRFLTIVPALAKFTGSETLYDSMFFLEKWQKQVSLYMFVTTRDVKNPKEYKPMNDKIRFVLHTYFWPLIVSLYVAYMRIYAQTGISMSEESFNEPRFFHYGNLLMQYLEIFFHL